MDIAPNPMPAAANYPADRAVFEATYLALKQHARFRTGPRNTYFSIKSLS